MEPLLSAVIVFVLFLILAVGVLIGAVLVLIHIIKKIYNAFVGMFNVF